MKQRIQLIDKSGRVIRELADGERYMLQDGEGFRFPVMDHAPHDAALAAFRDWQESERQRCEAVAMTAEVMARGGIRAGGGVTHDTVNNRLRCGNVIYDAGLSAVRAVAYDQYCNALEDAWKASPGSPQPAQAATHSIDDDREAAYRDRDAYLANAWRNA